MSESLDPILLNLLYAFLGGLLMLFGGFIASRFFQFVMGFDVKAELKAGNVAVGLALMGIYLATGIGLGLVIGLSLI
ncbi:MAG: DUF350 domain-containing protein [Gammaproteobacteria bacterium]